MPTNYTPTLRVSAVVPLALDGDERNAANLMSPAARALDASRYTRDVFVKNYDVALAANGFDLRAMAEGRGAVIEQAPFGQIRAPRLIAAGNNGLLSSLDGRKWSSVLAGVSLEGVAYSTTLNLWAACGAGIRTSPDGTTWSTRTVPSTATIRGISVDGQGGFVAVGAPAGPQAFILRSTDGVAWSQQTAPIGETLYSVAQYDGDMVAVGGGGTSPRILYSYDWEDPFAESGVPGGVNAALTSVTHNGYLFAAISLDGRVITSRWGDAWSLSPAQLGHSSRNLIVGDPLSGALLATSGPLGQLSYSFDNGATFESAGWLSFDGTALSVSSLCFALDRFLAGSSTGYVARGLAR